MVWRRGGQVMRSVMAVLAVVAVLAATPMVAGVPQAASAFTDPAAGSPTQVGEPSTGDGDAVDGDGPTAGPADTGGSAVVGVDKVANPATLTPGQETEFRIVVSCSSLEVPCVNLTVTDVLPAEFDVTSLPQSNSQRIVTYDPASRLLTVAYVVPLGGGAVGLPAGASQAVAIGMRLPGETTVLNGQVITNTAEATAQAADPASDSAVP